MAPVRLYLINNLPPPRFSEWANAPYNHFFTVIRLHTGVETAWNQEKQTTEHDAETRPGLGQLSLRSSIRKADRAFSNEMVLVPLNNAKVKRIVDTLYNTQLSLP